MTRKSLEEIINKFKTGDQPFGEDFEDLIVACYDKIQEVDGVTIVDVAGSIHVNIDGVTLVINETTGKLEVRGGVGPRGPKGETGDKGEDGNSYIISATYPSKAEMDADFFNNSIKRGQLVAITKLNVEDADHGDVYIKGPVSFDFLNNIKSVDGIKGEKGEKGDTGDAGAKGEKGEKGEDGLISNLVDSSSSTSTTSAPTARVVKMINDTLTNHTSVNATTTSIGHVKVGDGLNVSGGIISVAPKDVLLLRRPGTAQTISSANVNLVFSSAYNRGVTYNANNGQFTLKAGKVYRVTASGKVGFGGGNNDNYVILRMYDVAASTFVDGAAVWVPVNRSSMEASCGPLDIVVSPTSDRNYTIRSSGIIGNVTFGATDFQILIQEI